MQDVTFGFSFCQKKVQKASAARPCWLRALSQSCQDVFVFRWDFLVVQPCLFDLFVLYVAARAHDIIVGDILQAVREKGRGGRQWFLYPLNQTFIVWGVRDVSNFRLAFGVFFKQVKPCRLTRQARRCGDMQLTSFRGAILF